MLRNFVFTAGFLFALSALAQDVVIPDAAVQLQCEAKLAGAEPGLVQTVHVKEGELVEKDAPILSLDDSRVRLEAIAAARQAEIADLESQDDVDARFAEKSRAVAQADLGRAQDAVRRFRKSISKSELDQLRLVMERSQLAAEQANRDIEAASLRAELESARSDIVSVRLENMTVKAPFAGMVVQIQKHAGEWVGIGEPIARVIQLDQLRVEGLVDGRKYDAALLGKPAALKVTLPNGDSAEFKGEVTFVSSELHPVSGLVKLWAEIENPDSKLRPGMRGELRITK